MSLQSMLGARIFDTMRGLLSHLVDDLSSTPIARSAWELLQRTLEHFPQLGSADQQIAREWADVIVRSGRAAERMEQPGARPNRAAIPVAPWVPGGRSEDIRYTAIVTVFDPSSGETIEVPVAVWSDRALTGRQVEQAARDVSIRFALYPHYKNRVRDQGGGQVVDVRIVEVVRRG